MVKKPPANAGDLRYMGSIPGSGRFPREGNVNPLQYFFLEDPMDRGAWGATVQAKRNYFKNTRDDIDKFLTNN